MLKKNQILLSSSLLIIALLACNIPIGQSVDVSSLALTITAQALLLQTDPPSFSQETATPQFTPTITLTPTSTLSPTPSVPMVTVSQNTNCRTGPGTQYDLIGAEVIGQNAEVVGKYSPSNYWIIKTPGGTGTCWLWGQYATVSGNTANLPEYPVPPTPTPSLPAAPKDFKVNISCNFVMNPFVHNDVDIDLSWVDVAVNEEGYKVYRDGALLATLGANSTSYSDNTSLPGIWLAGDPPPSVTYGVEAFNGAGKSNFMDKTVICP